MARRIRRLSFHGSMTDGQASALPSTLCRRPKALESRTSALAKGILLDRLERSQTRCLRVVAASVLTDPEGIAAGFRELPDRGEREPEPSLGSFEQVRTLLEGEVALQFFAI
jgi:hypothetical protein